MGPLLDLPNIFDFGLVFAETFVLKKRFPAIVYYGERIFCVLLITPSPNSLSHFRRRVAKDFSPQKTLSIFLLRRVVTPRIVYYAESHLKCAAEAARTNNPIPPTSNKRPF